jgi:hypothetical protein
MYRLPAGEHPTARERRDQLTTRPCAAPPPIDGESGSSRSSSENNAFVRILQASTTTP